MNCTTKAMAPSTRQKGVLRIPGACLNSTAESVDSRCGSNGSTHDSLASITESVDSRCGSNGSTRNSRFSVSFSNIRGLRSNFAELSQFLSAKSPDVLAVSETRLSSEIPSCEVTPDGYVLHRLDRSPCHGLAVFAKPGLPLVRLTEYEDSNHEFLSFACHLEQTTHLLFFLYRSPSATSDIFDVISDKIDSLLTKYPSAKVSVFGDFNVHNKEWLTFSRTSDSNGKAAEDFALSQNLTQIVDCPTRIPDRCTNDTAHLLDLFLTSHPEIHEHFVSSPLGNSDHCVVTVKCKTNISIASVPFHRTVYRYSKADWCNLRSFFSQIPWNSLPNDCDQAAREVAEWISIGMKVYIPSRTFQQKPHSQPWFTPECAAAIAHRNHFFHRYHRDRTVENLKLFKVARAKCRRTLQFAKDNYANYTANSIANQRLGSKDFWRIVNSVLKRNKSSLPSLSTGSDRMATTSAEKAELLCSTFAQNSSSEDDGRALPIFPKRSKSTLNIPSITVKQVRKIIAKLDSSKSSGPDGIPVVVLKECAPELAPVFTKVFNRCLLQGEFPKCWKSASVVPVPKKCNDSSHPSNYRPISLLPVIGKVFEAVINFHLVQHLEQGGLLTDKQFGFRKSRSTGDLLAYVTEYVSRILDAQGEVRSVALDISKAFDKVWHRGLIHKLSSYGIEERLLQLLSSFLQDREIAVVVDGQKSATRHVDAGVPQGSILGPTLFLVYINDLPDSVVSNLVMYADDTTLFNSIDMSKSPIHRQKLCDILNSDLQTIKEWGCEWLVSFNPTKTKSILHSRARDRSSQQSLRMAGIPVEQQDDISILGLTLEESLSWKSYLQSVGKRASQRIGCLYRARRYLHPQAILHLYKSTVRPLMEYCCHLWAGAPRSHLNALDRIQRRVKNLVGPVLAEELQPLSVRRDVASLSLFYRYYFGQCSSMLSECVPGRKEFSRSTRAASLSSNYSVQLERSRTVSRSNSFFVRTSQMWNGLPESIFPKEYDLFAFKRSVNRFLKEV